MDQVTHSPQDLKPLVIVGPSGVGKSTLISRLMNSYPGKFSFSVSCTTRNPRAGETNGVQYHFITREEFMDKVNQNDFIEWAEVHTNLYGTSKRVIREMVNDGKICILDIDVQGTKKVVDAGIDVNRIFIMPRNINQVEERLRNRGLDQEETIGVRVRNAQIEIQTAQEHRDLFPEILVNDELETAVSQFLDYIRRSYPHLN